MGRVMTFVVESDDGEPLDVERVRAALRETGCDAGSWAEGDHLLATQALARAVEQLEIATRMVRQAQGADRG